jgi:hypothetical protein
MPPIAIEYKQEITAGSKIIQRQRTEPWQNNYLRLIKSGMSFAGVNCTYYCLWTWQVDRH